MGISATEGNKTLSFMQEMEAYSANQSQDFNDFRLGVEEEEVQDLFYKSVESNNFLDTDPLNSRTYTAFQPYEETDTLENGVYQDSEGPEDLSAKKGPTYHQTLKGGFSLVFQKISGINLIMRNTSLKVSSLFISIRDLFVFISEKTNDTVAKILAVAVSFILYQLLMTLVAIAIKVVLMAAFIFVVSDFLTTGISSEALRPGFDYVEGMKRADSFKS